MAELVFGETMIDSVFLYTRHGIEPIMTLHGIIDIGTVWTNDHYGIITLTAQKAIVTHLFTLSHIYTGLAVAGEMAVMLNRVDAIELTQHTEPEPFTAVLRPGIIRRFTNGGTVELKLRLPDESMISLKDQENWRQFDYDLFKMLVSEMQMTHKDAMKAAFAEDKHAHE